VLVAGKTGSLSGKSPDGRYEWFAGVAPAEKPVIAVAAVVVRGRSWRSGSQVAAEVLQAIFCADGPCRSDGADWLGLGQLASAP
jgi:cell division protein FtsI/penicillin-binding protein 2